MALPSTSAFAIRAQWDSRELATALSALAPRQWAFATALALTNVGKHVKVAEQLTMRRTLDRPTPYTVNSLYLKGATAVSQQAHVWFKEFAPKGTAAGKYLQPQVLGGQRSEKRFERALQRAGFLRSGRQLVPASGAPLDAYGNVSRGLYTRILTQLRASVDPGQNVRSRRRRTGAQFFYGSPGGGARGIWRRFPRDAHGNRFSAGVEPVFLETKTKPRYRPRFAFFDVAERTTAQRLGPEFDLAAARTLRTAR